MSTAPPSAGVDMTGKKLRRALFRLWPLKLLFLIVGSLACVQSLGDARLLKGVDRSQTIGLVVDRTFDANRLGWYRDYRAEGALRGDPFDRATIKIFREDLMWLRPGTVVPVLATGQADQPFVSLALLSKMEPRWTLGSVSFTWKLLVGLAMYAAAALLVLFDLRRPAFSHPAISLNPAFWNSVPERYRALVSRLEREAAVSPEAYRRRVIALGLLGYLLPFAVLILLVRSVPPWVRSSCSMPTRATSIYA